MKGFLVSVLLVSCAFCLDQTATAPEEVKPVLNIFVDRAGFLKDFNYAYVEFLQIRNLNSRWSVIAPDIGLLVFHNLNDYQELFVGVAIEFRATKSLTIDHEVYFTQTTGPDSRHKAYYQPWTRVEYKFPKSLVLESVAFPYIPLNGGTIQFVMERTKLEYTGFKRFNFGGGFGAYQDFTFTNFQSKPFATVTLKTHDYGNFEIWVQAVPHDGVQIQYRHTLVWHSRH